MPAKAFLAHGLADAFEVLQIPAAIQSIEPGWRISPRPHWRALHSQPDLSAFELQHGVERERDQYNVRCMAQARSTKKPVLGHHAGLYDYFVPIVAQGRIPAVLATGPFATSRPTSADVLERWRWLTGRQGHPADPEFAHYVSLTLSTLTLEGSLPKTFERFLVCVARLMAQEGDGERLLVEADMLRNLLEQARLVDQTWAHAASMVDEHTARGWASPHNAKKLDQLGLGRVPEHVLVGLVVDRRPTPEPVDELMRRDAFQRACVALAFSARRVIAGRIGDHGVTFLSSGRPTRLVDLGDKAVVVARRRFGLELHLGLGTTAASASLPERYESALGAAETALSRRARIVHAPRTPGRPALPLHELRRTLGELSEQRPADLSAELDRYLEALAVHCGHRVEPARGHLEAAFEHVSGSLLDRGVLEPKSFSDMSLGLGRAAREARTLDDLFAAYRRVFSDMGEAARHPVVAQRDRSLRRAVAYIERHYGERLPRSEVARVAGFAPNHFSTLFRAREGATFAQYVRRLRIERARQLLADTDLDMQRVAELSGFGTRYYLARVFKQSVGVSPLRHRRTNR